MACRAIAENDRRNVFVEGNSTGCSLPCPAALLCKQSRSEAKSKHNAKRESSFHRLSPDGVFTLLILTDTSAS
jgi:hypothetical protein